MKDENHFEPLRLANGQPIDFNLSDLEATQQRFKELSYRDTKHDQFLDLVRSASQAGVLSDLISGNHRQHGIGDDQRDIVLNRLRSLSSQSSGPQSVYPSVPTDSSRPSIADLVKNIPKDIDVNDIEGTQRRYYSKSLDSVKGDPFQRDVWFASSLGKLKELIEGKHDWDTHSSKDSLAETFAAMRSSTADRMPSVREMVDNQPGEGTRASGSVPQSRGSGLLDGFQSFLDGLGVFDPTPISDGANAVISFGRAMTDPQRSGEHLSNAAISIISGIVPYVGDVAKVGKYGRKAVQAERSGKSAGRFGRMASAASNALGNIPMIGGMGGGSDGSGTAATGGGSGGHGAGGGGVGTGVGGNSLFGLGDDDTSSPAGVGMFQKAVGAISISLGTVIGSFRALDLWLKRVNESASRTVESNRHLALYNGKLAGAYMQLDAHRVLRDVAESQHMSGSLTSLVRASDFAEKAEQERSQPYREFATNMQAMASYSQGMLSYLSEYIDVQRQILRQINSLIAYFRGDQENKEAAENSIIQAERMIGVHKIQKKRP